MNSPIETMILNAVVDVLPRVGFNLMVWRAGLDPLHAEQYDDEECRHMAKASGDAEALAMVFPQAKLGQYNIDFVLLGCIKTGLCVSALGIECDGHDWHDRTKQQASYDRARDRELLKMYGVTTVRFTGSDIHRDTNQCAIEIAEILKSMQGYLHQNIMSAIRHVSDLPAEMFPDKREK